MHIHTCMGMRKTISVVRRILLSLPPVPAIPTLSSTPVFVMTWADCPPSMQEPHPVAGPSSHLLLTSSTGTHRPQSAVRLIARSAVAYTAREGRHSVSLGWDVHIQELVRKIVAWMVSSRNSFNRAFCLFLSFSLLSFLLPFLPCFLSLARHEAW